MKYNNIVHNKNPDISYSPFITNEDKAEYTALKATLSFINENLSAKEINDIIKASVDDKGKIDKSFAINLAFEKKSKEVIWVNGKKS